MVDTTTCNTGDGADRSPEFYRVITYTYDGPTSVVGTKEDFMRIIGSCADIDTFSENMLDFFSSFRFDTSNSNLRQKPFTFYTDRNFNITYLYNEHVSSRAILGSFYEFGEYLDSPVFDAFVQLTTQF